MEKTPVFGDSAIPVPAPRARNRDLSDRNPRVSRPKYREFEAKRSVSAGTNAAIAALQVGVGNLFSWYLLRKFADVIMAKIQSPGQKRKKIVRIIGVVIFLLATWAGSLVSAYVKDIVYAWADDHQQISASVIELSSEQSEYRNLKGRKRYETIYLVSYDFKVGEENYSNTIEVGESLYSGLEQGGKLSVWYASTAPDVSDAQVNIESALASNSTVGNMISVVPFTAPAALFIYYLLSLIFVRESKKKLAPGFYGDHSWLDVDDHQVVFLDGGELVYFDFDKKYTSEVQRAYQEDKPLDELIAISKTKEAKRIDLQQISRLKSEHNSDKIGIKIGDDSHLIEFLNQAIKAHALERIQAHLPAALEYDLLQKSRFGAARPALIFLTVIALLGWYFDALVLQVILVMLAIGWVVPTIFSRLFDPTEIKTWARPENSSTEAEAST